MNLLRMALAPGAALLLGLAACGETPEDAATNGEDSAMTVPENTAGEPTPGGQETQASADASTAQARAGDVDSLPEGDQCGASKVAQFVSQEATPAVRAQVAAEVGHTRIRWIGPDTVVTMDFSPERLNVLLDANDVISGARCS